MLQQVQVTETDSQVGVRFIHRAFWFATLWTILFWGTPDLLDAMIHALMSVGS